MGFSVSTLKAGINLLLFVFLLGSVTLAGEVTLTVNNRDNFSKIMEPVTSGVPFAQSVLRDVSQVRLLLNGSEIPVQASPAAWWPDNSIRWLHISFQADLPAAGSISFQLQTGTPQASFEGITLTENSSSFIVNTGSHSFTIEKDKLQASEKFFEVFCDGNFYRVVPDKWYVEEEGPIRCVLRTEGDFVIRDSLIQFRARMIFFRNKDDIHIQFVLRNNNSFGWDGESTGAALTINNVYFGEALMPAGEYVFAPGMEKSCELDVPLSGPAVIRESRYNGDGTIAEGYSMPGAIAAASPEYYISTKCWGEMCLPKKGFNTSMQADFDLYEKILRAKVLPADLQNPPGTTGITLWKHLYKDIDKWNDYGDLSWGGDCGRFSGNHYDWSYGMFLNFFRTGIPEFADAARLFARHEIDFDIYHTNRDGNAFNYMKNWETRPSHESPDNCFGGGRPTHSWLQGYILYWLFTAELRGKDALNEMSDGIFKYIYESFNENGYVSTSEIRLQGWLTDNLVAIWRVNPDLVVHTSMYGDKTIPEVIKDVLKNVFDREKAAGSKGYVYVGDYEPQETHLRHTLQLCYFIEPAIKAYREIFKDTDPVYAAELLGLIQRMTDYLITSTYGGDLNNEGYYRPLQIPMYVDTTLTVQMDGQIPYLLMAANAAGFCYSEKHNVEYLSYARKAFSDYVRYSGVVGGDEYVQDTLQRTPAAYNSAIFEETESKIQGWALRYGQYYLSAENEVTGIDLFAAGKPDYSISQNFPNPFNPVTTIRVFLPENSKIKITVYNMLGKEIESLIDKILPAGYHEITFNGSSLPSGVYLYRVGTEKFTQMKKMCLLK